MQDGVDCGHQIPKTLTEAKGERHGTCSNPHRSPALERAEYVAKERRRPNATSLALVRIAFSPKLSVAKLPRLVCNLCNLAFLFAEEDSKHNDHNLPQAREQRSVQVANCLTLHSYNHKNQSPALGAHSHVSYFRACK